MKIQLSDHFTYKKLFRFVIPTVVMMVFTSILRRCRRIFCVKLCRKNTLCRRQSCYALCYGYRRHGLYGGNGRNRPCFKAMGQGEQEKAKRYFSMMIYFTVIMAVILSVVGIVFMERSPAFSEPPTKWKGIVYFTDVL